MLLLHVYVQFYLQQLDNKFQCSIYAFFLYTQLWYLTTIPQCFLVFRQHTPNARTQEDTISFTSKKKKKKKVVVVQKRYPKDISTTQGCELRDRVVLWNECLGELLTKTPLYPSLEK